MRVKGDDTPIAPAEFRDVDVPSGAIKDNLMLLPYKEPSQVLLTLLNQIVDDGRRFANTADLQASDMSANAPVGTTLAILERTLKVMSAVQARIHYSMRQELRLLKNIIADYTPEEYEYEPAEGNKKAKKSDYEMVDVIPVSDPNAATLSQKVVQYQAVMQLAQQAPQLYDLAFLHRQMLDVLSIPNANKLVALEDDQKPMDPMSENINAMKGKPLKAFIYQDQDAHIAAHQAFMQNPVVAQTIGQNPQANLIMASLQAHIAEHLGFSYRAKLEKQMGVTMPPPDKELPKELEVELSKLIAVASQQLLQADKAQAAQQQAQQQAQDPLIQLQQAELQIKGQEIQRKAAKDQTDAQMKGQQLQIERERIQQQAQTDAMRIQAQTEQAQARNTHDNDLERTRLGVQTAIEQARLRKGQQ
jgi:hypothetical protein